MRRILLLIPAVLLLSACGGSTKTSKPAAPALKTIQVSEKEFSITPSTINLQQTGTYSFQVTNNGQITHSFEVEGNGVKQRAADIEPGRSATLTVTLSTKGSYQAFCPIDGHRSKGMQARLTVGTAAPATTTTGTTSQTTTTKPGY